MTRRLDDNQFERAVWILVFAAFAVGIVTLTIAMWAVVRLVLHFAP